MKYCANASFGSPSGKIWSNSSSLMSFSLLAAAAPPAPPLLMRSSQGAGGVACQALSVHVTAGPPAREGRGVAWSAGGRPRPPTEGDSIMENDGPTTGWTGGQNAFGDFAPGMVHYTDKVLFDEVWEREGLSKRDRSLITVAGLTALGRMDQLQFHLAFARQNGVTDEELKEALLQLAFYSGWPNGMGATTVLKNIIANEPEA